MKTTPLERIEPILSAQRQFFATGRSKSTTFRIEQLKKLLHYVESNEENIANALWSDLRKSPEEAYLTETAIVVGELKNHIKNLVRWARAERVPTPLFMQPSKSRLLYEPLGVALIISPWNYPFQLLLMPLIGAISAGCSAVVKTSPYAPHTAKLVEQMAAELFPAEYVSVVHGNREVNQELLKQRWDFIFFTGSPALGKVVMRAAAEHLTPVVLELGGKSPAIVNSEANIALSARRLIWGKCINAGQTCIAPDYLLVHKSVKKELLEAIELEITKMYGDNPKQSQHYPRIVSDKAMERLMGLMEEGEVVIGGEVERSERYIAPTVIEGIDRGSPIMKEEIFGPLLPLIEFAEIEEAISFINSGEKPLALYYFGSQKKGRQVRERTSSGGACINDTLMHVSNHHLPFGGVGNSGMGKYHGHDSFLAFSNRRSVASTPTYIDLPFKYAPFRFFSRIKSFF